MHALLLLAALATGVQDAPQPATASEQIEVNIVDIDVVVLDASGKPVRGLTRDDFELTVAGRKQPISNFYASGRAEITSSGNAAVAALPSDTMRPDRIIIFIDDAHLHPGGRKRTLDALRAFVQSRVVAPTAAMLVASDLDLRVLQPFTSDASVLTKAIDALEQKPAMSAARAEAERRELLRMLDDKSGLTADQKPMIQQALLSFAAHEQTRAEQTLASIERMFRIASGLDGRRTLVYVSDGLPMQPGVELVNQYRPGDYRTGGSTDRLLAIQEQSKPLDEMRTDLTGKVREIARLGAAAGVPVFAIDAGGLRTFAASLDSSSPSGNVDPILERENAAGAARLLAAETGGRFFTDRNDFAAAFGQLEEHLTTYYSLGYRSEGRTRDADIRVRVKRPGMTVLSTSHVRERTPREQLEERVRAGLYLRSESNPLDADVELRPTTDGRAALLATVRVPTSRLSLFPGQSGPMSFAVFVMLRDEQMDESPMRMARHEITASEEPMAVQRLSIAAKPGTYVVSIAVADAFSWEATYLQREITIPPRD